MQIRTTLVALAAVAFLLCACHSTTSVKGNSEVGKEPANNTPDENKEANKTPSNNAEVKDPNGEEFCLLPPEARPDDLAGKIDVGDDAPDFTFAGSDGTNHKLSDYRGKTVLLFFWASWCPYCKAAFRPRGSMNKLTNDVDSETDPNLVIINIGSGSDDRVDDQEAFMKTNNVPAIHTFDKGSKVVSAYGVLGIPTCVVVGTGGTILTFGSYRPDEYSKPLIEYLRQKCIKNPESK